MNQADLERSICRLNLSRRNPIQPAALRWSGPAWCTKCTSAGAAGGPMRESKNGFGLPKISHLRFLAPLLKFPLVFLHSACHYDRYDSQILLIPYFRQSLILRPNGLRMNRRNLRMMPLAMVLVACGCTSLGEFVQNGFKVGPNYERPPAPLAS